MKTTMKLAMSIAMGMFMLTAMPSLASAQEDIGQKIIPSLELEQADVREALRALFKNVNVSYSIAPEVQGTVTVSLKNVTFDTAIQNVLRQVDATYRVEAGVYEIVKKTDTVIGPTIIRRQRRFPFRRRSFDASRSDRRIQCLLRKCSAPRPEIRTI